RTARQKFFPAWGEINASQCGTAATKTMVQCALWSAQACLASCRTPKRTPRECWKNPCQVAKDFRLHKYRRHGENPVSVALWLKIEFEKCQKKVYPRKSHANACSIFFVAFDCRNDGNPFPRPGNPTRLWRGVRCV